MWALRGRSSQMGQLPHGTWRVYYEELPVMYTVMSYDTPIAWITFNNISFVPNVFYSRTTSHHQNLALVHLPGVEIINDIRLVRQYTQR